jgi:crotonobetainyl-CoA:carnitine CoA-transferase CaiB-like acyl-CoA transferase
VRGVRVLEMAGSRAGAYCGRLFAIAGADVVVVEPPDGAPTRHLAPEVTDAEGRRRSATHEYLASGKRSVVLTDAEVDDAFRWADLVISTFDGDPDGARARHARIAAADPSTVHVVLSGFGLTGPYASWRNSPLVDWASGGYLYLTGEPDREPLQGGGPWAAYLHGATAAIGAQAAVIHAARTGEGQLVDVGAMESVAAGHQWSLTMYTHTGAVKGRWGRRFGESFHPMGPYQTGDGEWIAVGAASRDQWDNFCITTEIVELMADDTLYSAAARFERSAEIDALVAPWLAARTADEAVAAFQANRVPASRLLDFVQVLDSEQLAARQALCPRPDIAPATRVPARPFSLGEQSAPIAPPPAIGADTEAFTAELAAPGERAPRPVIDLRRTRLVEFGIAWAGPLAARTLGDLGVEVIKVEHPLSRGFGTGGNQAPDSTWRWGELAPPAIRAEVFPHAEPGERRWNRMGTWNKMNRSKRSLCLDAKPTEGVEVLQALLASADLVMHNYTPRGARSLGIDPDHLHAANDHVASVAMTGYGETGPMATHSSYGPMLEAHAGFAAATGYRGEEPLRIGLAFPDAVGGLHGAFALLAARWEQALTGAPVHVDLSQLETLLSFAGEAVLAASTTGVPPVRLGNRSEDAAPQGVYRCDGADAWVAVTVQGDAEWVALTDLLRDDGLTPLAGADRAAREAASDVIDAAIGRWTRSRPPLVAAKELQSIGVAACPAFTNRDLVLDDHLAARGFIVSWDHADVGPQRYPGSPFHFERTPVTITPTPLLGQHNRDVLTSLGYDDEAIDKLHASGVIADAPPD